MYEHKQLFDSMLQRVKEIGGEHGLRTPQAFPKWFADMFFEEPTGFVYADGPGDAKIDLFFKTSNGRELRHHIINSKFVEKYNSLAPVSFYDEIGAFWRAFKNKSNRGSYLELVRPDLKQDYARLFDRYDEGRADLYFLTNARRNGNASSVATIIRLNSSKPSSRLFQGLFRTARVSLLQRVFTITISREHK